MWRDCRIRELRYADPIYPIGKIILPHWDGVRINALMTVRCSDTSVVGARQVPR